MTSRPHTAHGSLALWALALSFTCVPLSQVQAKDARKAGKPDSEVLTVASLNGLYAYANLAQIKAGYGMLKLDGRGNLTTDDITLNRPHENPDDDTRVITRLGPGSGTYSVDPNGVGKFEITFTTQPDLPYLYEFVIEKAVPEGKQRAPLAIEVFTSSDTTGVANAAVTFVSPLNKKNNQPVARFNVASIEGRYAYTNNADYFASYGVLVFDGKGNVHSDGKLNLNAPVESGERVIRRIGPGSGTYTVGSDGKGSFTMRFDGLDSPYTWEFVITEAADENRRRASLATALFSVVTTAGVSGQLVAPVLTRIFPQ